MEIASQDASPELSQKLVDAHQWLETAHASETVHSLATSSEEGAKVCQSIWGTVKGMAEQELLPGATFEALMDVGEKVVVKTFEFTREVYATGKGYSRTHIEFQRLGLAPE